MSHVGVSKNCLSKVKEGFVRKGVILLGVKIELLTMSLRSGGSEGGSGPTECSSRKRGPTVLPPGCHLRKGQWEEGEDEGALTSVVTLSYTH